MRPRRPFTVVVCCSVVALAGCGGSSLLDGSTASELQDSLGQVQNATDEGRCAEARTAARDGLQRVDGLPGSVDADLRDRLRTGFQELLERVGTDCETTTTTTESPTDTVTTDVAPPTDTDTTTTDDAAPSTTSEAPPTIDPGTGDGTGDGTGGTGTGDGSGGPGTGDTPGGGAGGDDSGGVAPGVDGPGATERSRGGATVRERVERQLRDWRERARKALEGRGDG